MKHTTNRAAVILIAVALLFCAVIPAGCKAKEADDAAVIEELSRQFIENFGTGDTEQLEGIVEDGFEYDFIGQENTDILLKIASRSEIVEFKGVSFDREDNTARARLKVSYIYVSGFVADQEGYMTYEDYLEAVDTYEDRRTMSLTINFRYDEDEGQWLIKKTSAENYLRRFDYYFVLDIVKVSPSEAEDMILNMYEDMAEGGFDQLSDVTPLVQEAFVAKLLNNEYETDPAVTEAAPDFSAAYYKYIVDSGITITASDEDPYTFTVTGYAPAKESILEYFSSDEFLIELYMADIRSYFGLQDHDEIWSSFFAGVYYDLAKKLPGMPSEEYSAELYVDPYAYNNNYVWTYEDCLIPVDSEDVYWAGAFSDLDAMPYIEQAAEALLLAGEITEDQYDEYLDYAQEQEEVSGEQTTGYYGGEAVTVDWDGTEISSVRYEYGTTAEQIEVPADPERAAGVRLPARAGGFVPRALCR